MGEDTNDVNSMYDKYHTTIMYSVRFSPEEEAKMEYYRQLTGMSVSEIIRTSTINRIDDELDTEICEKATERFKANPVIHTYDEIMKRLGLK